MFKKIIGGLSIFALIATSVAANPAVTTANLNFRTGPSTSYPTTTVIPDGTRVELLDCNDSGSWCAVTHAGEDGFVSGRYLNVLEDEDGLAWPRAFQLDGDAFIVLYQPQFSAWDGVSHLEALVAAEYRASEEATPVFGVIGLSATAERNEAEGTILLTNPRVISLDFTALDSATLKSLSLGLNNTLPTGTVTMAEERVLASLASYTQVQDVEGLNSAPPAIFVSTTPAVLVMTDGPAVFATIAGVEGLEFILNTNWDAFRHEDVIYLRVGESWLALTDPDAGWEPVTTLPPVFSNLPKDGNWDAARAAIPAKPFSEALPEVFYSEEPAELILFDGPPVLEDVPGTELEWASNTEFDLFRYKPTGEWYFLISGRWFRTLSREGPFEFASNDLPSDFRFLPDDKPYYAVRASVPGTSEANEARLRATIPETAVVERGADLSPDVAYADDPIFEPIEGTEMQYAVNTDAQVIKVGDLYYVVQDGVWFVGQTPTGPWVLATEVPDVVYDIPPSSPVHNVTYVRVYETTDSYVRYGYTTGYLFMFLAWGALVYGSGWRHSSYYYYGRRPYYYPRPVTYGIGAYYNPARGSFGRYGVAYGPYRGIASRTVYNPRTGTYARGTRAYGPYAQRGFVRAANPRTGTRGVARSGSGPYGAWASGAVRRGSEYARLQGGSNARGGQGMRWDTSRGNGFVVSGRRGNVYAGRDGEVYRRVGDNWQQFDRDGWAGVQPPGRENLRQRDGTQARLDGARAQPARAGTIRQSAPAAQRSQNLSSTARRPAAAQPARRAPSNVQRDLRARELSNQRAGQRQNVPTRVRTPTQHQMRGHVSRPGGARAGGRAGGMRRR